MIPEIVSDRREYEERILEPIYESVAHADPEGVLRHEWLNSRGAIARFDRSAIEIRLADTQECPGADIAVAQAVCAVTRELFEERRSGSDLQANLDSARLVRLLEKSVRNGESALIDDRSFLRALGVRARELPAREVWRHLVTDVDVKARSAWEETVSFFLKNGTLATRILRAAGDAPDRTRLREVYGELSDCLEQGRLFECA